MKKPEKTISEAATIEDWFRSASIKASPGLPLPGRTYESLFWRPYLGGIAFVLWEVLLDYQPEVKAHPDGRWPTISVIEKTLGIGDRSTVLGRDATATRPERRGELDRLRDEGLVLYSSAGEEQSKRYWFSVIEQLPFLTPAQANRLPPVLRRRHLKWIKRQGLHDTWKSVAAPTLVRPFG
jgi:hypothetical protein